MGPGAEIRRNDPSIQPTIGRIMKSRIMYIESKSGGLTGPARIGRVKFSKTGATLYYGGKAFQSLKGSGFKSNYFDVATGERYWISGPRKDGQDALYATHTRPVVDEDVRNEYFLKIRRVMPPDRKDQH
jgi:hypothetical protein